MPSHLDRDSLILIHNTPAWWWKKVLRPMVPKPKVDIKPQGAPPQAFHHITVTGSTEFHDYETFGSDEHGTFGFRQETMLSTNDLGTMLLTWRKGFGGEERVELDIDGSLRADGVLAVNIQTRFYEGATEGTNELED